MARCNGPPPLRPRRVRLIGVSFLCGAADGQPSHRDHSLQGGVGFLIASGLALRPLDVSAAALAVK